MPLYQPRHTCVCHWAGSHTVAKYWWIDGRHIGRLMAIDYLLLSFSIIILLKTCFLFVVANVAARQCLLSIVRLNCLMGHWHTIFQYALTNYIRKWKQNKGKQIWEMDFTIHISCMFQQIDLTKFNWLNFYVAEF